METVWKIDNRFIFSPAKIVIIKMIGTVVSDLAKTGCIFCAICCVVVGFE